jgi:hypothetical protein
MNIRRILVNESEKKRILEMYSDNNNLITEAAISDFPECVRNVGKLNNQVVFTNDKTVKIVGSEATSAIWVYDSKTKYTYYWLAKPKIVVMTPDANVGGATYIKSYHCGCKNGKLKPITRTYDGNEKEDEKKSSCVTQNIKVTEDKFCRLKGDKNWVYYKEGDTWYASKNNGVTWIKLDPIKYKSSIDLLNKSAVCGGGEQTEGCKTKCAAKPLQPGQTGPQVQGWFFSKDGVCYEATGTGGFSSKEECEACKCGSSDLSDIIGDGSWKEKYPCIEASLQNGKLEKLDDFEKCGCFHLKDGSCIIYTDGTAWCEGTDPSKGSIYYFECFQNEIIIKKEKPIQDNVEKPNKPISGGGQDDNDLPDFKPPFIQKPSKPLD